MTERSYQKGELLFSQGDDADAFYLLKQELAFLIASLAHL